MKIWCDVCDKEEAIVFCSADEAALCESCDRRVHHANKLASKHSRFFLLHSTFEESPVLCDICQERRAFLFCQEDRAILCRECDVSIHKANEHTLKHSRFLLTGVKLSSSSPNGYGATIGSDDTNSTSSQSNNEIFSSPSIQKPLISTTYRVEDNYTNETASIYTSNISEYVMEILPGWRVDDFLEPSSAAAAANDFLKGRDFENDLSSFSSQAIWVPEVSINQFPQLSSQEANVLNFGCGWIDNESFLVPQIRSALPIARNAEKDSRLRR